MSENDTSVTAITNYYTPVEVVGIYRSYLERGKSNGIVWLRGIYQQVTPQNPNWGAAYDELRDVSGTATIKLKINWQDRERLKPNSLVLIGGLIELNPQQKSGIIQILVNVTRVEVIKDQFVTEQDVRKQEIRIEKAKKGFKNVDALLEDKLFKDEEAPRVALVFATTSITMADFNEGVHSASAKINFTEHRQSFGNATALSSFLLNIDNQGYDVIALIRGGGSGRESLDELEVLQTVASMNTAIICAVGHPKEELFLKSIADKVASTPNGLGQYFSDMVERVIEKRNNSRAALVEDVKKQFQKQLEESNKKNQALLKQIEELGKQSAKQTQTFNDNIKKQQEEHQKTIENIQKQNQQTLENIQKQNKEQVDNANKQNANLQKRLDDLTKTQQKSFEDLQKKLEKRETESKELKNEIDERKKEIQKLQQEISMKNNYLFVAVIAILIFLSIAVFNFL